MANFVRSASRSGCVRLDEIPLIKAFMSDRNPAAERAAMEAEEDEEQSPDKKLEELYKSSRPTVELLPGVNLSAIVNSAWLPRDAKVRRSGVRDETNSRRDELCPIGALLCFSMEATCGGGCAPKRTFRGRAASLRAVTPACCTCMGESGGPGNPHEALRAFARTST